MTVPPPSMAGTGLTLGGDYKGCVGWDNEEFQGVPNSRVAHGIKTLPGQVLEIQPQNLTPRPLEGRGDHS